MKSLFLFLSIFCLVVCKAQTVNRQAEGEKIMQLSRDWSEAASSGDVEKTLSYWADDAVMIGAGQPPLKGKEAIRQMVTESFNMPGFRISWQPQSVEVSECGDIAYLIEDSQVVFMDASGETVTQHNKSVTIWKKQSNGSWKNVVDIATPTPAAP